MEKVLEQLDERQLALTDELIEIMKDGLRDMQAKGLYTRAAHAKTIGLMKARFEVNADLPEDARVGVFEKPGIYRALVRGSSSSPSPRSDRKKDARGLAIKLLEVEGERFAEFNNEVQTQDFIFITWPAFFFSGLATFTPAARLFTEKKFVALGLHLLRTGQFRSLWYVAKAFQRQTCLLDLQYWSMTPYCLGDRFVKYTLRPTSDGCCDRPHPLNDAYLCQNLERHLAVAEVSFDFCVQFFKNKRTTSLTDAMAIWHEDDSPPMKVATLTIPRQEVGTQERMQFGENLSFSPGHCLAVHRPVGELNLARLRAYQAVSKYRHEMNQVLPVEPSPEDYDRLC